MENTYKPSSMRSRVYHDIQKFILNGTFQKNRIIKEKELTILFEVSRTPIREAIYQLEAEGLIKIIPNKGILILGISNKEISEIYMLRESIERMAMQFVLDNISKEQITELKNTWELQEYYCMKKAFDKVWELDSIFHQLIYDSIDNKIITRQLTFLHIIIQNARMMSIRTPMRIDESINEHKQIYNDILNKDITALKNTVCTHIRNAREAFLSIR